jgi:enhancing lycopene biosynthesis protein 2
MKKFAVILCGSGSLDGSEIYESVMTLWAIDKNGGSYTIFAPDENQYQVINHITKKTMNETRNMMIEASRIARGEIYNLKDYKAENFDALIFPGGNGSAKNLFTYGLHGVNATVLPEVERAIKSTYILKKPIGALCIAPVLLAKVLGNVTLTIGSDPKTIADIEKMGANHIKTQETEVIADKKNSIFTTPCFMLPATISDIAESADKLIKSILNNNE